MNFSRIFIERPVMTALLSLSILLFGGLAFRSLPVAALPSVDYPTIQVTAAVPGANPETMASTVATPLEREFSTIAGVDSMSSSNSLGATSITVQFTLDRKIDAAAQDVQAAISRAGGRLPPSMPRPPSYQQVDPDKLASRGIGIDEVQRAVAASNSNLPTGRLDGDSQAFTIQSTGSLQKAANYRPVIVAWRNGSPVRLEELGEVIDSVDNDK